MVGLSSILGTLTPKHVHLPHPSFSSSTCQKGGVWMCKLGEELDANNDKYVVLRGIYILLPLWLILVITLMCSCQSDESPRCRERERRRPTGLRCVSATDLEGGESDVGSVSRALAKIAASVSSVLIWRSTADHSEWRSRASAATAWRYVCCAVSVL